MQFVHDSDQSKSPSMGAQEDNKIGAEMLQANSYGQQWTEEYKILWNAR